MDTYLWIGPTFVHYTLEDELCSETADPRLICSLHKQGRDKKASVPLSYK